MFLRGCLRRGVVFMSVTSVLICRMILPRFCSGEFFTFCLSFF